jgi:hypothetical protein
MRNYISVAVFGFMPLSLGVVDIGLTVAEYTLYTLTAVTTSRMNVLTNQVPP